MPAEMKQKELEPLLYSVHLYIQMLCGYVLVGKTPRARLKYLTKLAHLKHPSRHLIWAVFFVHVDGSWRISPHYQGVILAISLNKHREAQTHTSSVRAAES